MASPGRSVRPAVSIAAVPTAMLAVTACGLNMPGNHRAKLKGSSSAAARRPRERKPRSLMKEPCTKCAATAASASRRRMERRV